MLVIGRVVGFREHLRWFDNRPLFGVRVLVTRPREQARGAGRAAGAHSEPSRSKRR